MNFNKISLSVCVIGLLSMSTAYSASNTNNQLKNLQSQINQLQSKLNSLSLSHSVSSSSVLNVNSSLSEQMLGNFSGVGKERYLLQARQNGSLTNHSLTIGGLVQADAFYTHTNTPGGFTNLFALTYLDPENDGTSEQNYSHLALSNIRLATTAALNNWTTAYIQLGAFNIGDNHLIQAGGPKGQYVLGINQPEIQQAYVVIGNLEQTPVYGFAGKKDIDFGNFGTVNLYSQPLDRTGFYSVSNTAGLGYQHLGFNATASILNGGSAGSYIGTYNQMLPSYLYTANANSINNFALNTSYQAQLAGFNYTVGAGYLSGADQSIEGNRVGAADLNAMVSWNKIDLLAEFTSTTQGTATDNLKNQAWDIGGDYKLQNFNHPAVVSLDYSQSHLGSQEIFNPYQIVAGYRIEPYKNLWAGVEYAYYNQLKYSVNQTVTLDITAVF